MSPLDFLTRPQRWLWAIHRCGGTISAAPNFAYELCLRRIEEQDLKGLDLSSWRVAFNGAEPVSPDTIKGFCERFAQYGFRREAMLPVYGLAECAVGLAFPPLHRGPLIERIQREPFLRYGRAVPAGEPDVNVLRMVACGGPLPGHQIRVVDPTGQEVPERQEGRLQFRGPSATSGYFRNPGETRRLFDGDWLESGDLAYLAGGEVYITGRIKDVIIRAGRNIYPHELEEAVGNMPGIRKGCVAVFGTTDPDSSTERFIVLAETREKEPKTLEQLASEINALTVDLVGTPPDDVVLAPPHTVPKTSSGKIRRAASREIYERGQIGHGQRAVWWQVARVALAGLVPQLRRAKRAAGAGFYAAYAWLLFLPLVPFTWLSTVLLPRVSWRWAVMHHAFRLVARAAGTRIFIRGFEDLPPRETPRVLVANHGSYLDAFYLIAAWPHAISFVAKAELAKSFFSRIYLQGIQTEFVERSDTQQGIADAKRVMQTTRSGKSLLFFPEGGFTRIPGLLRFRMGAFVSAVEAEVPLVPVAIRGTRSILRDGSWLPRRGSVTITIGKPIDPKQIAAGPNGDAWTRALKLRDAAREHILRYCGEPDLAYEKSPV
jgi:1-acyl-sn-glycerol-3-phosphate acyltransferase